MTVFFFFSALLMSTLVDGSFESFGPSGVLDPPHIPHWHSWEPYQWAADPGYFTVGEQGVVPYDGEIMRRQVHVDFRRYDRWYAPNADLFQLVPVEPGGGEARATGRFNRAAGTRHPQATLALHAFASDLQLFGRLYRDEAFDLAWQRDTRDTDDDPNTWELFEASIEYPPETRYLAVGLKWTKTGDGANFGKQQFNDFNGHYIDAATLEVAPVPETPSVAIIEPSGQALSTLAVAVAGILGLRRRINAL